MAQYHTLVSTLSRRQLFSAALVGLSPKTDRPIAGSFVNDSHILGHRLRDRASFQRPARTARIPVVIIGAGIAGLSAAWKLDKLGLRDFVLLELESQPGGNSRWGQNEISPFPWAAHYVPVPSRAATLVRELFAELGLLRDGHWDERHLCHSPQERLFLHGRWQSGLEPEIAATRADRDQYREFERRIADLRASGQFTIPIELGAKPSLLDQVSMSAWLDQQRFTSPYLRWYVDYACRDDYGASLTDTSAWAAIHYFAARESEEKGPLTWPEGNGWIVKRLLERLGRYLRTGAMVYRVARDGSRLRVLTEETEYIADSVIFTAPTFLASHVVEGAAPAEGFVYSPWLTANLTLDRLPREPGVEPAWDNVIYNSPSLGYVVATHQSLRTHVDRTVWTYYWALASGPPARNRALLIEKDWSYWKEAILTDLARAHPDIRQCVSRIDIMRLGHAMVRPVPGFLFSAARRRFAESTGKVIYANSDLSGLSIFEEAQYRGVRAASRVAHQS